MAVVDLSDIHLSKMRFRVTRNDGKRVNFSQFVTQFIWIDHVNVSASEVALELNGPGSKIRQLGYEGTTAVIDALVPDVDAGGQFSRREIWRGFFEEVTDEASSDGVTRQITAYDAGKSLATDEEDYVFKGATLSEVVRRIATDFQLPMGSVPSTSRSLGNIVGRGEALWDLLQRAIQKHANLTGEVYRVRFDRGRLSLVRQGTNENRWVFERGRSVERVRRSRSITDLENKIKIYGNVTEELDRGKVEAVEENTRSQEIYGIRQRVEYVATAEDEKKVRDLAKQRLDLNSIPRETVEVTGWAVPLLRAGERVRLRDTESGATGLYYLESIESTWSSDGSTGVMTCRKEPVEPEVFIDNLVVA